MLKKSTAAYAGRVHRVLTRAACSWLVLLSLACASSVPASGIREFASDGCSLFPDGTIKDPGRWCDCCFQHDIAYWQGGSREDRLQADEALRDCVLKRTGDRSLARVMYDGVRAGGHPAFPAWYRWGYGWEYGRGYAPLSPQEQARVKEKMMRYSQEHPAGFCRKTPL